MQFNSISFIFYFLPLFLAVYHISPGSIRPAVLALGSLLFYALAASWNTVALAALSVAVLAGYLGGIVLGRAKNGWRRKMIMGTLVLLFSAALIFFKLYLGGILLPAGMSFYVFQLISYEADIYMGRLAPERNFVRFAAGTLMFPKLLSGPIARNGEIIRDTLKPHRSMAVFHLGLQEFILGLAMKVILANHLGAAWSQGQITGFEAVSTAYMWLALVTWCMRLYFDFAGYSLMALGLGHMLGYDLPVNFREPYSAKTVSDFFRRWHATLGNWFHEYIYIPLGGNRKGTARTVLNLAVVWLLTGLWHGVGGGYLLWAVMVLFFIILERLWLRGPLEKSRILSHVYLVSAMVLCWVPFATESAGNTLVVFGRLFAVGGFGAAADFRNMAPKMLWPMLGGAVFTTPFPGRLWMKIRKSAFADVLLFVLFWACLWFIATAAQDPFIYYNY